MEPSERNDLTSSSNSEELRADIEATRTRLSETAEGLAYKSDVPASAMDALNDRAVAFGATLGSAVMQTANSVRTLLESNDDRRFGAIPVITRSLAIGTKASTSARRRPLATALGSFAIGFALGRVWPRRRPQILP